MLSCCKEVYDRKESMLMRRPDTIGGLCERALALNREGGASRDMMRKTGFAAKWLCAAYEEVNGTVAYSDERLGKVECALSDEFASGGICHETFRRRRRLLADVSDVADYGVIGREARMSPWRKGRNPLLRPVPDAVKSDGESVVGLSLAVLDEMERIGYSANTVRDYRLSALPRLVWYFEARGTDRYSDEVIDAFVADVEADDSFGGLAAYHEFLRPAALHVRMMHDEGRLHSRADESLAERARRGGFGTVVAEFVDWRDASGAKPKTVRNDVGNILPFLEAACPEGPDAGLAGITREGVRAAMRRLGEGRTPRFINRTLTSVRAFARFAEERHPECPAFGQWLGAKARDVKKRPIEGYSAEHAEAIAAAVDASTDLGKRDLAILLLLKSTGMRGCDVVTLTLDDIDWRANEVRVVQEKTGVAVALPLDVGAGEALADYLLHARRDCAGRPVFTTVIGEVHPLLPNSVNGIVKRYASRVDGGGFDGPCGPHSFRRGLGAGLAAAEVPIADIADVLGQSEARSAMPYVAIATERLRERCASLAEIPGAAEGAGHGAA